MQLIMDNLAMVNGAFLILMEIVFRIKPGWKPPTKMLYDAVGGVLKDRQ